MPPPTASFSVDPSSIPENTTTPITLALAGTGTTWSSGSTVTVTNTVGGAGGGTTVVAGTFTAFSPLGATLTVTTGFGTGSWLITVDGVASGILTVVPAIPIVEPGFFILLEDGFSNLLGEDTAALLLESVIGGDLVSFVNPKSVQLDRPASNAMFGSVDPTAVQ